MLVYDDHMVCWRGVHIAYVVFAIIPIIGLFPAALSWTANFKNDSGLNFLIFFLFTSNKVQRYLCSTVLLLSSLLENTCSVGSRLF